MRESLFASLGARLGHARVLDLFAGSGILGVEALSRGASSVTFVERSRRVASVLEANLASLSLEPREARVLSTDVLRAIKRLGAEGQQFDLVLLDPPYDSDLVPDVLQGLTRFDLVAESGLVLVEHPRERPPPSRVGSLGEVGFKRYGTTQVTFFEREEEMSRLAIYPGSFDPVTNGHVELIRRGLGVFDRIVVAVATNAEKSALFSKSERVDLLREVFAEVKAIEVDSFEGLLVDYMQQRNAAVVMRGLRAVSDFEYEFQMATMNRKLYPGMETCFMMAGEEHFYVSSKVVREVAQLGGPVEQFVPPVVVGRLRAKVNENRR